LGEKQEPLSFIVIAKNDQQFIDLFEKSYPKAPMIPDFWNAKVHDFGFEKETNLNSPRMRHHARFWKTNYIVKNGYNIYVGTASFDSGIKWGIAHKINPDIDTEREFLYKDLQKTGMIEDV